MSYYDYCKTAYNNLADAWNMFMDTGQLQNGILRPDSYTSWIRCDHKKIHGPIVCLSDEEFARQQSSSRILINNYKPVMRRVDCILRHKEVLNYALILMDSTGLILDVVYSGSQDIPLGNRYHELLACSNAINISRQENKMVEVYGYDHIYPQASTWNTIGDRILNYDKSIAGAFGIVSETNNVSTLVPIVKIASQLVQSSLVFEQIAVNKIGLLLEEIPEAAIAVNQSGEIISANQGFSQLSDTPLKHLIGKNIRDYLLGEIDYRKLLACSDELSTINSITIKGQRKNNYTMVKKIFIDNFYHHSLITLSFKRNTPQKIGFIPSQANNSLHRFEDLIGETMPIKLVKTIAQKTARSFFNVLIEGESGTGKELLAQSIHMASRSQGPFVAINCGALTRELLQSELFGYEEGAFTGAIKGGKPGKFEQADGGSIFLDEIGEMPIEMQVSLLRCLQDKTVTRVGGSQPRKIDIRIIAATNRNLYEQVRNGTFREDLYYRLNVIEIKMPPLRERVADIPLLCSHILSELSQKLDLIDDVKISPAALDCLCQYHWPGNVRELQNVLERAVIYSDGNIIDCECLPLFIRENPPLSTDNNSSLKDFERTAIMETVLKHQGNISKSAAELGIARSTLYQKMKRLEIPLKTLRK